MSETTQRSTRLGASMVVVSSGILLSRVFGLLRDVVFAKYWGTGAGFAAFVVAFTLPNLLRTLFGEGAFSAAFVPVFSERLEKEDRASAWRLASRVITLQGLVLLGVVLAITILSLVTLALGPEQAPPRVALTLKLVPLVMPYALLICMTGAISGVLNSLGYFAIPAITPVLLNIVLIAVTLLIRPFWEQAGSETVYALGLAVLLAGLLQFGLQLVALARQGLRLRLQLQLTDPHVRKVVTLLAPVLFGTGVTQLNVLVDRLLALHLGKLAVGALYYSQRLIYLPVGLFGVAMGIVCLPAMSRAWLRGDHEAMRLSTTYALRHVLFLSVPCAALLAVAGVPTLNLLFARGAFAADSLRETAWALLFYLPGIPAFCCAKVAVTPFYARHETRTPVKIACLCMLVNLVLNLILMQFLRQGGLALATTISSYLNVTILLLLAWRRHRALDASALLRAALRLAAAAAMAALAGHLVLTRVMPPTTWDTKVALAVQLAACVAAGAAVYLAICTLIGSREPGELLQALLRRRSRQRAE